MKFHPDDFLALMSLVEAGGGALADGLCIGQKFRLKQPNVKGDARYQEFFTTGCGKETRFLVPYKKQGADSTGLAVVCAQDDNMGMWPRYKAALQRDSN